MTVGSQSTRRINLWICEFIIPLKSRVRKKMVHQSEILLLLRSSSCLWSTHTHNDKKMSYDLKSELLPSCQWVCNFLICNECAQNVMIILHLSKTTFVFYTANMEYMSHCNATHNAVCRCKKGYECKVQPCKQCLPIPPTTRRSPTMVSAGRTHLCVHTSVAVLPD